MLSQRKTVSLKLKVIPREELRGRQKLGQMRAAASAGVGIIARGVTAWCKCSRWCRRCLLWCSFGISDGSRRVNSWGSVCEAAVPWGLLYSRTNSIITGLLTVHFLTHPCARIYTLIQTVWLHNQKLQMHIKHPQNVLLLICLINLTSEIYNCVIFCLQNII